MFLWPPKEFPKDCSTDVVGQWTLKLTQINLHRTAHLLMLRLVRTKPDLHISRENVAAHLNTLAFTHGRVSRSYLFDGRGNKV